MRRIIAVALLALALAACGGSSSDDGDPVRTGGVESTRATAASSSEVSRSTSSAVPAPATSSAAPNATACDILRRPREDGTPFVVYSAQLLQSVADGNPVIPSFFSQASTQMDSAYSAADPALQNQIRSIEAFLLSIRNGGSISSPFMPGVNRAVDAIKATCAIS